MSNYAETKKRIDAVRKRNEVMFRMAISHLMDVGIRHLTEENVEETCKNIMTEDDTNSFMTNEYKCDLVRMAFDLAQITRNSQVDLLVYIQREAEYDVFDGAMTYKRVMRILKECLDWIEDDNLDTLDTFKYLGLEEDEIESLGYGYLLDSKEDEEND